MLYYMMIHTARPGSWTYSSRYPSDADTLHTTKVLYHVIHYYIISCYIIPRGPAAGHTPRGTPPMRTHYTTIILYCIILYYIIHIILYYIILYIMLCYVILHDHTHREARELDVLLAIPLRRGHITHY
jgi:hypothetical protein